MAAFGQGLQANKIPRSSACDTAGNIVARYWEGLQRRMAACTKSGNSSDRSGYIDEADSVGNGDGRNIRYCSHFRNIRYIHFRNIRPSFDHGTGRAGRLADHAYARVGDLESDAIVCVPTVSFHIREPVHGTRRMYRAQRHAGRLAGHGLPRARPWRRRDAPLRAQPIRKRKPK